MLGRQCEDQFATNNHLRASCHDQAAIAGARKSCDGALDFGGGARVDRDNLHAAGRRHGLYNGELAVPAVIAGSRRTAARVTSGAISLSSSSHFPLRLYSNIIKPVTLPPGRDRVPGALDEVEALLQELPLTLTLNELGLEYPESFDACARSFPMLVAERAERPLQLQARALHHIGEVRRVKTSEKILENLSNLQSGGDVEQEIDAAMRLLGALLDQSHASLRDLYQVSTPEVERLIGIIRASPGVYGAHLMGGGFGGNVLALVTQENVERLIERVQKEYYGPQNRQGVEEGSVMISTPGEGLAPIEAEVVWREAIEEFNASGPETTKSRSGVNALLDNINPKRNDRGSLARDRGSGQRYSLSRVGSEDSQAASTDSGYAGNPSCTAKPSHGIRRNAEADCDRLTRDGGSGSIPDKRRYYVRSSTAGSRDCRRRAVAQRNRCRDFRAAPWLFGVRNP